MYKEEQKAISIINECFKLMLDVRKSSSNNDANENLFIDQFIENEKNFTQKETEEHLSTLFSGAETVSISLSHIILLLAMNPEVQDKLYEELKTILNDDEESFKKEIKNCDYLDKVYKEANRVLPPVPLSFREVLDDFEIEPGTVLPKGSCLVINFFALHHNKAYWGENSEKFVPERFSEERIANTYLPFSAGQRICIAFKFSEIEIKIFMARLLEKFKFSTSLKYEELKFKSFISLKLCGPHLVKIQKRQ